MYFPRIGEDGVAERLFAQTKPADSVPSSPIQSGFFAVLDLPTALQFALPIAKLTTGVDKPVVTLNPASLEAGYAAMTTTQGRLPRRAGASPSDPTAWPLTKVDHMMFPSSYVNTNVGVHGPAAARVRGREGSADACRTGTRRSRARSRRRR